MPTTVDSTAAPLERSASKASPASKVTFKEESTAYFTSLRAFIDELENAKIDPSVQDDPVWLDRSAAFDTLRVRVDEAQAELDEPINADPNQSRRDFLLTIGALRKELESLQAALSETKEPIEAALKLPDYCTGEGATHLLPAGNGIVIRENEVSSLM